MDRNRWKKISFIIDAALSVPEKNRTGCIQTLCEGDSSLLQEVYELLDSLEETKSTSGLTEHHFQKNEALLHAAFHEIIAKKQAPEAGGMIGDWKLLELLGRGGMGTVYKAKRQRRDVEQVGALKIIHHHLNTPEHLHRFHLEQQILAGLHHPNVTVFIDGGVSEEGLPFLVMEYVEGIPLLDYCDAHRLSVDERIRLFKIVCNAVQYAHKKLIIHRDLKPDNILVTDSGHIKVLDFGIAKLIDPGLSQLPVAETREGLRLMSLEYASPEQAAGEAVSTSTDIYALGILLFELLAGIHPLDLEGKKYRTIVQMILNDDVLPFHHKLTKFVDRQRLSEIAESRLTDPGNLIRSLKGDLDAIVRKALRKEPEHRYESVIHFLEDIERYQYTRPVLARKGTYRYRFSKFINRNRTLLAAAALFLIITTGFVLWHVYQVTEQRNIAQVEAEKANRIKEFTTTLFDASNPYHEENIQGTITANQLLEAGILNIETELIHEPEIYAEMHTVIGRALLGLGEYSRAKESIHKSMEKTIGLYGEDHLAVAANMVLLGRLESQQGNIESALNWVRKALAINRNEDTYQSINVANNYADLGKIYAHANDYEKASEHYQTALAMYKYLGEEQSTNAVLTLSNLASVQARMGLLDEAKNNELQTINYFSRLFGNQNLPIAGSYSSLALIYFQESNFEEAEKYAQKAYEMRTTLLGANHPRMKNTHSFMGVLLQQQGKYPEAAAHYTEAVRLFTDHSLTDSLSYASILNNFAVTKSSMEQYDQAVMFHQKSLEIKNLLMPPDHSTITVSMYNLADVYYKSEQFEKARELFEQVVERDKESLGSDHPEVAVDLVKLAAVTRDLHEFEQAGQLFSEAELIFSDTFTPNHHRKGEFYMEYGRLKMMKEDFENAIPLLDKSLSIFLKNYHDQHEQVVTVQNYLAESRATVQ